MKVRTRSSAIIGALFLAASLTLTTASADEPPAAPSAQVVLTEVARAQGPSAGADRGDNAED